MAFLNNSIASSSFPCQEATQPDVLSSSSTLPKCQVRRGALEDDSVLVCWCAPEACHSEVIEECSDWLRRVTRWSEDERNANWIKLVRGGRSNRQELRAHKIIREMHMRRVNEENQSE